MRKITKLVLPVGGLGKRLQPLTLHTPKALVLAGGKPMLDYVLAETKNSSFREAILVISPRQKPHFKKYVERVRKKFPKLKFYLRVQEQPLGTGHVLLPAESLIKGEPFAVRFADDILFSKKPALLEVLKVYEKVKNSVLTLRKIPRRLVSRFGVVGGKRVPNHPGILKISKIIEKPKAENAPSNLVLIGSYVLMPSILDRVKEMERINKGNLENDCLPITDAFAMELEQGGEMYGWEYKGKYLDCGTLETLKKADRYLRTYVT